MSRGRRSVAPIVFTVGLAGCGLLGGGLLGCSASRGASHEPTGGAAAAGAPLSYAWGTTDGRVVTSDELRGRATVLLFVTTFDLASQAEAKHLEDLYRSHKPRINAVAVVMEAPKYAPLASSFAEVLGLSYPVALADDATRTGQGPFGVISSVPSWVILDRDARPVFAHAGVVAMREIERGLRTAQR